MWLLGAFALLTAFTALSITWSLTPSESWLETNRMLAYLATLAGGLALGRLAPGRWAALIGGVALASVLLCLWALLTKVFPGALAADETFARLRAPFEYWNSVGLSAALGVPPMLWLAARRSGHGAVNVLAWPALGLLLMCLLLAFSRGSLLAVAIGLALWLAVVPLRLRALATLGGVLRRDGAARRVGVRAGRAHRGRRPARACASTPARRSAALLLLLIVDADDRRPRRRLPHRGPPAEHARRAARDAAR